MKKMIFFSSVIFFLGCAQDKPLATNVADLSGNQQVVGWEDETNSKPKIKVIYKEKIIHKVEKVKDSDKDGIIDKFDKCPNTPKGLAVDHNGCPIIATLRINFDFNKANVKKIYYKDIKKLAAAIKANPKIKRIMITGYTDNTGSKRYNYELSVKRAKAVAKLLVKFGIKPNMIISRGYGEDYPLVPNTTDTNRALNRRVEIVDITK